MDKETFIKQYAVERRGTDCLKWDLLEERFGDANLLPMWVADAEFKTADSVREALARRIEHGVFGYTFVGDHYYDALNQWMTSHFNCPIHKDWVRFSTGVVEALYHLIQIYSQEDDSVIIQTPVYYPFHNAVRDTNRRLITVDLQLKDGDFVMNTKAFEQAIIDSKATLYIHCSPHNPVGRVWTEQEMDDIFAICEKHDVMIISDEIHQDFIFTERPQIPAMKVNEGKYQNRLIIVNAASKSFNLASLIHSHIIIPNDELRRHYDEAISRYSQTEASLMGMVATEAAYRGGEDWLNGFKAVIQANYDYSVHHLAQSLPVARVTPLEGTYLMLIDLSFVLSHMDMETFIQDRCGIAVDYGDWFGANFGQYIRVNLATIPQNIEQTIQAIIREGNKLI